MVTVVIVDCSVELKMKNYAVIMNVFGHFFRCVCSSNSGSEQSVERLFMPETRAIKLKCKKGSDCFFAR